MTYRTWKREIPALQAPFVDEKTHLIAGLGMEVSNRDCSDAMSSTDVNTGRRKRGRYLGILALVVAAGFLLILLFGGQEKRSIQLKDNTTLKLRAVTYGTHHDPQITPIWLLKLDEALPRRLQGLLAPYRMNHLNNVEEPELGLWFTAESGSPAKYHPVPKGLWFKFDIDSGCPSLGMGGGESRRNGFEISGQNYRSFPRRSPRLKIRAYQSDEYLGEFEINQPAKGPFPTWTARPLPQSITNGDVEFHLRGFASSWSGNGVEIGPYFRPDVFAYRNGVIAEDWHLQEVLFKDPTGNITRCGLREDEPVWRLSTSWVRKPTASFGTNEMMAFENVPIPQPGQIIELARSATLSGAQFQSIFLCGPGEYIWTNNAMTRAAAPLPQLYLTPSGDTLSGMVRLQRSGLVACLHAFPQLGTLYVRCRDDQDRWSRDGYQGGDNLKPVELQLEPDARTVHLEIIPQLPFLAEFDFATPQFPEPLPAGFAEDMKRRAYKK